MRWVVIAVLTVIFLVWVLAVYRRHRGNWQALAALWALAGIPYALAVQLIATAGSTTAGPAVPPQAAPRAPGTASPRPGSLDIQQLGSLKVAFEEPAARTGVPLHGVKVSGSLEGDLPPGHSLWLFKTHEYYEGGPRHYISGRVWPSKGEWSLNTGQVGSSDSFEVGRLVTLKVLLADEAAQGGSRQMSEPTSGRSGEAPTTLPRALR